MDHIFEMGAIVEAWMEPPLRLRLLLVAALAGIGLTCASFAYQRMGPEIGVYGNTCEDQPQGLCSGPLLGAGLPLQYVVDQPGVSVMYRLGVEDQWRVPPFVLDAMFYGALAYTGGTFMARYRKDKVEEREITQRTT